MIDVASGASRAVSPEGATAFAWRELSPDGRTAVALAADGTPTLYPIEGGEPRPLPGTTRDDVASGARRLWKELPLPDPAGVMTVGPIQLSADGESYVHSYRRAVDDLMLATGVR